MISKNKRVKKVIADENPAVWGFYPDLILWPHKVTNLTSNRVLSVAS